MIQLSGQYQLSDFKAAQDLHAQKGKLVTWTVYFLMGLFALGAVVSAVLAFLGFYTWPIVILSIALLGAIAFIKFVLAPYQMARLFEQQKGLSGPFQIELRDDGLHLQNELSTSLIPWGDFIKWRENQEMLLLYNSDAMFCMLPKHVFHSQDEIDYVLSNLSLHNVPHASKVRDPANLVNTVIFVLLVISLIIVLFVNS